MGASLGLIQAFSVRGELLILDEPTKGLDPTSQAAFAEMLQDENRQGRAVLLSSHVLEEIERICDRIVFIDRGRIMDPQTIERAREAYRQIVRVTFRDGAQPDLTSIPGVREVERERSGHVLRVDGPIEPVLNALAALGVESLDYNRPNLVDIYRSLYLSDKSA